MVFRGARNLRRWDGAVRRRVSWFSKIAVSRLRICWERRKNKGVDVLMSGLNTERIHLGALSLGISRGAFESALKYAKERVQFGKPIAAFQLIQSKLADMSMEIELSRLIMYKGAAMADRGLKRELNLIAAYAKLFTSECAMRITTEAVQILGGYGYMKEFPVERMMRDAKLQTIGGGTSEIQRLIIAREILSSK